MYAYIYICTYIVVYTGLHIHVISFPILLILFRPNTFFLLPTPLGVPPSCVSFFSIDLKSSKVLYRAQTISWRLRFEWLAVEDHPLGDGWDGLLEEKTCSSLKIFLKPSG